MFIYSYYEHMSSHNLENNRLHDLRLALVLYLLYDIHEVLLVCVCACVYVVMYACMCVCVCMFVSVCDCVSASVGMLYGNT